MRKRLYALFGVAVITAAFTLTGCTQQTKIVKTKKSCCSTVKLSTVKTPWGACPGYNFWGCANDKDCDCIPDAKDKCPMDKENYNNVDDTDGCPDKIIERPVIRKMMKDSDNDGITDDRDACPFVAGPARNNGCPLN
jgi:hypothetical protein